MLTGVEGSFSFAMQTNDFKPLDETFIIDLIQKIKALFLALIGGHSKENRIKVDETPDISDYISDISIDQIEEVNNIYTDCGLGLDGYDHGGVDWREVINFDPRAKKEVENG